MLWAIKQILAPSIYLRIRLGETLLQSKRVYDWVLPAILAAASVALYASISPTRGLFGEGGMITGFQKLLELLVPFFIAALAAVATFNREGLDEKLRGEPALLEIKNWKTGQFHDKELTRRQFICYLFGYLSALSLFLFVLLLFVSVFRDPIFTFFAGQLGENLVYAKCLGLFVLMLPIWQLMVTTLLGVYFLSDRLQTMDMKDE